MTHVGRAALALAVSATFIAPTAAHAAYSENAKIAIAYLKAKLGSAALANVAVTDEYTSDHNDVTHVYLRQVKNGQPVLGAEASVHIQDGKVFFAGHRFTTPSPSGTQQLTSAAALQAAVAAVGTGTTGTPKLAYRVLRNGSVRLAYNVQIEQSQHLWDVAIDAENGRVLQKIDNVDWEQAPVLPPQQAKDGSSYNVYPMPQESPNDGPRHTVFNPADIDASPFGWHDTNGVAGPESTITSGNNVNAYHDTAPDNAADPASQPDGGAGLDFDHPIFTFEATPLTYRDAAVDNLFYWNNLMHDVTFRYGFNEKAGNFQVTNYSGAGKGADAVQAEAQDGSGELNANFATPAEGQPGRMQMFLWADAFDTLGLGPDDIVRMYSTQIRDGDLDGGVISHEYGHGVSNRLIGGPSNVECLRNYPERQGEGWSDFWAYAMTMRPGDDGRTPRGIGTYVVYQDEGRQATGIRPTPYSTDMRINPATLNTIATAAEPHGVGYVWASMLWDLYWNLVDRYGFNPNIYDGYWTGGNNLAIQLVVDGMKLAVCQPDFEDARNAIIAADAALTGRPAAGIRGRNECLIWRTFARRGLGYSADARTRQSKTDQVEGYDLPPQCT